MSERADFRGLTMGDQMLQYPFNRENALRVLAEKRDLLGRNLSYVEKILFLHEAETSRKKRLIRGLDPIKLSPYRV